MSMSSEVHSLQNVMIQMEMDGERERERANFALDVAKAN